QRICDFARWISGATLNYPENCLRGKDEDMAFISPNLECELISYTYAQFRDDIMRLATALRLHGWCYSASLRGND
ncbi:hypothetical protein KIN20_007751, partial [Parelaphostrongylus tenuis]